MQLVELEDLPWTPRLVRDCATDYLEFIERAMRLHRPAVAPLNDLLRSTGCARVVDLCSGGAGPWPAILEEIETKPAAILLTDLYPNRAAFERIAAESAGVITGHDEPLDARAVPRELEGVRTIFNALHHFAPDECRTIIRNAVDAGQPIAVFDLTSRRLVVVLATLLAPLMVMLSTPFIRPFRWRRLLLTYVVPAIPFICLWDGVVSQLRAYTADELEHLARDVSASYAWSAGEIPVPGVPMPMTFLIGSARLSNAAAPVDKGCGRP